MDPWAFFSQKYSKILFTLFMIAPRSSWILKVTATSRKHTSPFVLSLILNLNLPYSQSLCLLSRSALFTRPDNYNTGWGGISLHMKDHKWTFKSVLVLIQCVLHLSFWIGILFRDVSLTAVVCCWERRLRCGAIEILYALCYTISGIYIYVYGRMYEKREIGLDILRIYIKECLFAFSR